MSAIVQLIERTEFDPEWMVDFTRRVKFNLQQEVSWVDIEIQKMMMVSDLDEEE